MASSGTCISTNWPQGELGIGSSTGEERGEIGTRTDWGSDLMLLPCAASSTSDRLDLRRVSDSLVEGPPGLMESPTLVAWSRSAAEVEQPGKLSSNETIRVASDIRSGDDIADHPWLSRCRLQFFNTLGMMLLLRIDTVAVY
jgi:hypothetical protein